VGSEWRGGSVERAWKRLDWVRRVRVDSAGAVVCWASV
jgi:hypothetical protein